MRITAVKPRLISIPRRDTRRTSYGTRSFASTVLIEVSTDEGVTGWGQGGKSTSARLPRQA